MDKEMHMHNAKLPRNASAWATPVERLTVDGVPEEALPLNVAGRRATGPLQGFGQLWQKTYEVRLEGATVTPTEVIRTWKANFQSYWPNGNYFYGPMSGVAPGNVAVLNLAMPGGTSLNTGIRVFYADDETFSFMTPEGHIFAGFNTFSAHEEFGTTVVRIRALVRGGDPAYEVSLRLRFGHWLEDNFWRATLRNLAASYGVIAPVTLRAECLDEKVQWSHVINIWHNAFIRTMLYTPAHLARRFIERRAGRRLAAHERT